MIKSEKLSLLERELLKPKRSEQPATLEQSIRNVLEPSAKIKTRFDYIEIEINELTQKNIDLEKHIESFLK